MKFSLKGILILINILLLSNIKAVAICDLATLKMELLQDIEDNGMLDCQLKVSNPKSNNESEEEKNKRVAAQWDSNCAFNSNQDWKSELKEFYGIDHLVDAVGDPYDFNSEEQADMCEIVRTILAKTKPNINMYKLTAKDIQDIDCPGFPIKDFEINDRNRICAATGGSFFDRNSWTIFLKPSVITIGDAKTNFPSFIKDTPKGSLGTAKDIINNFIQAKTNLK